MADGNFVIVRNVPIKSTYSIYAASMPDGFDNPDTNVASGMLLASDADT